MEIGLIYAKVMGYTLAIVNKLEQIGIRSHLVNWDDKKETLYKLSVSNKINIYLKSKENIN